MEEIRCTVERITYESLDTGYVILKGRVEGFSFKQALIGKMYGIKPGIQIEAAGEWKLDPRYGRQFQVERWKEVLPATASGMERFLGSGLIPGVSMAVAKRITDQFGVDAIRIIEEEPERLLEVKGISETRAGKVRDGWLSHKSIRKLTQYLESMDLNPLYAPSIYEQYGIDSIKQMEANPYQLVDTVWGFGFRSAEQLAKKLRIPPDDEKRLKGALVYVLGKCGNAGHTYLYQEDLVKLACQYLGISEDRLLPVLEKAVQEQMIRKDTTSEDGQQREVVYLRMMHYAECGAAYQIRQMLRREMKSKYRYSLEPDYLNEEQRKAVHKALHRNVMIMTGGPGTGKTTVIRTITEICRMNGKRVLLAGPTGRSAKRLSEVTGIAASTVHRLLEYNPKDGYQRNSENPIEGDMLILDECSMVDILMLNAVLQAMPEKMQLVLVGDDEQLPSVAPGNILRDLIATKQIPTVYLQKVYRQSGGSDILKNAALIRDGKMPELINRKEGDFFFIRKRSAEETVQEIVALVSEKLGKYYRVAVEDIQVITPKRKGITGNLNLNQELQKKINPIGRQLERGGLIFREKDKVMQIRNNYEKEVFNGEIGIIKSVNFYRDELTVDFEGKSIVYRNSELDELSLAYAITVHKSQGSEFPIVVMPVMMEQEKLLFRRLLYTGITRGKQIVVLVGEAEAVEYAVRNHASDGRNSMLKERILRKELEQEFCYLQNI